MSKVIDSVMLLDFDLSNIFSIVAPFVEQVGEETFFEQKMIHYVYAPRLKVVKNSAFNQCCNLRAIIGNQLEIIESNAFRSCFSLKKINLSNAIKIEEAFQYCALESVINHNCEEIDFDAFSYNDQLESISMTNLKRANFSSFRCRNLSQLDLPAVENIKSWIDEKIQITANSAQIVKINHKIIPKIERQNCIIIPQFRKELGNRNDFVQNRILYSQTLQNEYLTKIKGVVLLNQEEIGVKAFIGKQLLNFVYSPNTRTVKEQAFYNCNYLRKFRSCCLETVEESAFEGCLSLKKIDLRKVISVGVQAFLGCNLIQINMNLVESLPEYCFAYCNCLKKVVAKRLHIIDDSCFYQSTQVQIISDQNGNFQTQKLFQEEFVDGFVERKKMLKLIRGQKFLASKAKMRLEKLEDSK